MPDPVQLALDPPIDPVSQFEDWLFRRLPNLSPQFFDDPECLTPDARRARVRALIVTRGMEYAIAGKNPEGKAETWSELFRRVYEVAL